jgi:hypothetical protein
VKELSNLVHTPSVSDGVNTSVELHTSNSNYTSSQSICTFGNQEYKQSSNTSNISEINESDTISVKNQFISNNREKILQEMGK